MKSISRKLKFWVGFAALGAVVLIPLVLYEAGAGRPSSISLLLTVGTVLLAAGFSVRQYRRLKDARLIVENQILHFQPAALDSGEPGKGGKAMSEESIEVYVSCFGILIDSRIIKFNQSGVSLKEVELGKDFITLAYGTEKKPRRIKLLHGIIDDGSIAEIAERFRYETGILPKLVR